MRKFTRKFNLVFEFVDPLEPSSWAILGLYQLAKSQKSKSQLNNFENSDATVSQAPLRVIECDSDLSNF